MADYDIKVVSVEPVITLDAYTAVDVVGGLLTFTIATGPVRGVIRNLVVVDEDSQAEAYTLYLFDAEPSSIANDTAFAPTVADLRKLIGTVAISTSYTTINTFDYIEVKAIDLEFFATNGAIYGYLVATGTPDYASTDTLYLRLAVEFLI
jgi:hypothetical protein